MYPHRWMASTDHHASSYDTPKIEQITSSGIQYQDFLNPCYQTSMNNCYFDPPGNPSTMLSRTDLMSTHNNIGRINPEFPPIAITEIGNIQTSCHFNPPFVEPNINTSHADHPFSHLPVTSPMTMGCTNYQRNSEWGVLCHSPVRTDLMSNHHSMTIINPVVPPTVVPEIRNIQTSHHFNPLFEEPNIDTFNMVQPVSFLPVTSPMTMECTNYQTNSRYGPMGNDPVQSPQQPPSYMVQNLGDSSSNQQVQPNDDFMRSLELRDAKLKRCQPFNSHQTLELEKEFHNNTLPTMQRCIEIAQLLNLTQVQITDWFMKRRVKWRKENTKLEADTSTDLKPRSIPSERTTQQPCSLTSQNHDDSSSNQQDQISKNFPNSIDTNVKTSKRRYFTSVQRQELEQAFRINSSLNRLRILDISQALDLTDIQVADWFRDRRKKWRKEYKAHLSKAT